MSELALIYCNPSCLNSIKELDLDWTEADNNGTEIVVTVDNIPSLNNEELCEHYQIDYDEVNCIEQA